MKQNRGEGVEKLMVHPLLFPPLWNRLHGQAQRGQLSWPFFFWSVLLRKRRLGLPTQNLCSKGADRQREKRLGKVV